MANLSSAFQSALADHAKAAFVDVIAKNPKTTVRELAKLVAANPDLGGLTLTEIIGGKAKQTRGRKGGRRSAGARTEKRNVRSAAGRAAFDKDVHAALQKCGGENVAASELRKHLGADPAQLRASLNRMINEGKVTFTGKARGTRYSLA